MPRVLTAAEMKAAEAAAVERGTSYLQLMENAGAGAARLMVELAEERQMPHSALFICGRGNNAGDAFVAARLLAERGWKTELLLLYQQGFSALAAQNLACMPDTVRRTSSVEDAGFDAAFIVDGVYGTGFHGELPPAVRDALEKANTAPGLRLALDVPSGLDCDTGHPAAGAFRAGVTVTFGAHKPALVMRHTFPHTGEVRCVDIGL